MRGLGRIKRGLRRLRQYSAPAAVILTYHRIVDLPVDPYGIVVAPDHFYQHLECIRQSCQTMSLPDLIQAARNGRLPSRAVALTFDDGYVDFFCQAYPALASARLPSTVFVTTGFVDSPECFWSDLLTRTLLMSPSLPADLRLRVQGIDYHWTTNSLQGRRSAHKALYDLLLPLAAAERADILACLSHWAGIEPGGWAEDRVMTSVELRALAQEGLVNFGGHTISHPVLSRLPVEAQHAEIVGSRERLEALTGCQVTTFAYPHGTRQDFTLETERSVEAAGFQAACTTIAGAVDRHSQPFQLRRNWVGDWDIETFQRNLDWFFLQ